jgi:PAS domain S-box-containing protein
VFARDISLWPAAAHRRLSLAMVFNDGILSLSGSCTTSTIIAPEAVDELTRTAFERCPSGLIVVDDSGQIALVNHEVERQFGYTREELLGLPVEVLVPDALAAGHAKLRSHYVAAPAPRRMGAGRELSGRHKDGHEIPVEIGLSSVSTSYGHFVLATVVDVSQRRLLEERLRKTHKLEALGNLAGGIAHDFNNILQGIIGFTEQVRDAPPGATSTVSDLNVILETARRGRDLVNRILLFTRTTEPKRVLTDFEVTVHDAMHLLRASLPSNIEIREGFDPNTPRVMADSNELHQVAMNLATNAAYAMRPRGGVLEIRLGPVSVDQPFVTAHSGMHVGLHARLSVSDTGTGIPPELVERIFEPFFTTKPRGEGTGLGLSVIDRIVRSLRGTVEVKSRLGEGTRFDVYIPGVPAEDFLAREGSASGKRRTILLVDDEERLARLGQRVLESAGFEVTAHTSSLQALNAFRANPGHFDLIVTDNTMPYTTGLELVDQVLALRPNIPILIVSGVGEKTSIDPLKERGLIRLLSKPYQSADLKAITKELIETSQPV